MVCCFFKCLGDLYCGLGFLGLKRREFSQFVDDYNRAIVIYIFVREWLCFVDMCK